MHRSLSIYLVALSLLPLLQSKSSTTVQVPSSATSNVNTNKNAKARILINPRRYKYRKLKLWDVGECAGLNTHRKIANCKLHGTKSETFPKPADCGTTSCSSPYTKKGGNTKCGFDGWWIFGKDIFRATTCEYVCEQAYDGYCTECDDGYEGGSANARTASSTCVTCRAGHYCSAGNSDPCPAGKYSTQQGASSSSTCKSCGNADHHCPSGSQQVRGRATLPGSYALKCKNGIDCEDSTICPEGFYCYAGEKYSCPAGR